MKHILPARVRFGAFILDLTTGELYGAVEGEGERRILLQEQSFRVLLTLIERNREIATREEIKKKLWPNDTVVEFDHHINVVIGKLRRALGDSAQEPRYIETLARRGYRLMVPMEWMAAEDSPGQRDARGSDYGSPVVQVQPEPEALAGRTVSHYRVLDIIGGGGMGVVYRAEDLKLGRQVAVKFLPDELGGDPLALERFHREARAISLLDHPNICTIYEFGDHEGRPFMVMQLLQGQTVRERLAANDGPLPLEELLDIGIQVSDGLQAAHERGIIHRDIKPANIFITDKGVCKILDFGVAKLLQEGDESEPAMQLGTPPAASSAASGTSHLTRTGSAMGTAGYMSPEQIRGEQLDARSDLFSFGLVLYEMATGQRAFGGETAAVVHDAILNNSPVPVGDWNSLIPEKLISIVDRALEKNPGERYQSAAEMRAELGQVTAAKRPNARSYRRPVTAVAILIMMVVTAGVYWQWRHTIKLTDSDTIILADLINSTTDPVFDDALNSALRVELEQTPFLNLLAPDKIRGALKEINGSDGDKLTPKLAREICVHTHSKAYVAGSIGDLGNHYEIELKGIDCQTGKAFAKTLMDARNREQVVKTLGIAGSELRHEMGEPQVSLRKFNQPLEEAMTSSLEALQSYSQGQHIRWVKGDAKAIPYLQRAIELDRTFAVAYAALGTAYLNTEENELAKQSIERAYTLSARTTSRQRFYIEGSYYGAVTGELEKANQVFVQWTQTYPADQVAHGSLSRLFRTIGQYELASAEAKETLRITPGNYPPIFNLMVACMALNRLGEAKEAFDEALSRGIDVPLLRLARYYVGFLQNDEAAMREQTTWAEGKRNAEPLLWRVQAEADAYHGQLVKARNMLQSNLDPSGPTADPETTAYSLTSRARWDVEVGNLDRARTEIAEASKLKSDRDIDVLTALVMARAGEVESAQRLVDKLNQEFPLDTMVQNYSLPTIRAAMELQKKDPPKAIGLLQVVIPFELGVGSFDGLYPAYVRGLAYLDAGLPQQAATEFQKMLDHPGIVLTDLPGALAHLQLGRAQVMMGDKNAARRSYQDFLTLWKDADPDLPIYKQAKAEYARLQ